MYRAMYGISLLCCHLFHSNLHICASCWAMKCLCDMNIEVILVSVILVSVPVAYSLYWCHLECFLG